MKIEYIWLYKHTSEDLEALNEYFHHIEKKWKQTLINIENLYESVNLEYDSDRTRFNETLNRMIINDVIYDWSFDSNKNLVVEMMPRYYGKLVVFKK